MTDPRRLLPISDGELRKRFTRGREKPRGVKWFGASFLWGHMRHFIAAAIATEDVDSRDWMTPDEPGELLSRMLSVLKSEVADSAAPDLLSGLGRDLIVDYVADTGDDASVSRAVAGLVFASYLVQDPERPDAELFLPRGDLLVFGGDTAYPVATAQEITNRVLVPFNQVLESLEPETPERTRVLLGLPGNHDWYDGLDGFGRLFRRRNEVEERPSVVGFSTRMLEHYTEWAREFVRGGKIEKPKALVLKGYVPVQNASYFVLPLTPNIHLYGVDRQLRTVDMRQRQFALDWYQNHPEIFPWVMLPDPVYGFAQPRASGTASVRALGLDFEAKSHFVLSGDVHHYQRLRRDRLLHVVAGGGGAFLHPAPLEGRRVRTEVEWPTQSQSRALLGQVPWKIARGRSGFLPHVLLAALFLPSILGHAKLPAPQAWPQALISLFALWLILALIGGVRRAGRSVLLVSLPFALGMALLPNVALELGDRLPSALSIHAHALAALALGFSVFFGAFLFGSYLSLLTRLGLEHTQAFTALDHPGYKHFLRLRVRADGTGIDGFCIGLVDPVRPNEEPRLVDVFHWRPAHEESRRSLRPVKPKRR